MSILIIGTGQEFSTISVAVAAASHDGYTVQVGVAPRVTSNSFWNFSPDSILLGPASMSNTTWLTSKPRLAVSHPWS